MRDVNKYLILLDILIVTVTYRILYYLKFGEFALEGIYLFLFIFHLSYWLILSLYYNKYSLVFCSDFKLCTTALLWSTAIALFLTTSTVALTELRDVSRFFILNMTIFPFILEFILIAIVRLLPYTKARLVQDEYKTPVEIQYLEIKLRWVIIGAGMLILIYFLMIKFKTGNFQLYPWSEKILLILFAAWFVSIMLTKKYSIIKTNKIFYQVSPFIKSGIIMALIAATVYFFFRAESLSRFLVFGTILVYTTLETFSFFIYYLSKKYNPDIQASEALLTNKDARWELEAYMDDTESEKYQSDNNINIRLMFNQLSTLEDKEQIVNFLEKELENTKVNFYSSAIFSTTTLENIEIIKNKSKKLLINLHKLNDLRRINQFLITTHSKLLPEGYFIGYILPIEQTYTHLQNQMPRLFFMLYYPFHFLFTRVLPKISSINRLYFAITQGQNRSISKAEMYGRLNYCGFKIVNDIIINDKLFFVAKKVKTVSDISNPSYHPIVKLNRVGYNKELIQIHKFRTMHPYSEFLQKDIYEENELDISGKFKNDFRITSWGKIMRKFWIDELPQIYDWIQGRVNLVGVRALSEQYFGLYPKELQDLRTKFKPGIIPPYYVDMPKSLEEICKSEEKYLKQKEKAPLRTDLKYGIGAIINILFRGARSS